MAASAPASWSISRAPPGTPSPATIAFGSLVPATASSTVQPLPIGPPPGPSAITPGTGTPAAAAARSRAVSGGALTTLSVPRAICTTSAPRRAVESRKVSREAPLLSLLSPPSSGSPSASCRWRSISTLRCSPPPLPLCIRRRTIG